MYLMTVYTADKTVSYRFFIFFGTVVVVAFLIIGSIRKILPKSQKHRTNLCSPYVFYNKKSVNLYHSRYFNKIPLFPSGTRKVNVTIQLLFGMKH